jgi:hypothetical protein
LVDEVRPLLGDSAGTAPELLCDTRTLDRPSPEARRLVSVPIVSSAAISSVVAPSVAGCF